MQTNQKIINGAFVGLAVVVWFLVRQIADTVWGLVKLPYPADWPVTPADLIGTVSAIAVFIILKRHQRVNEFSTEVLAELSKVTWPVKKETLLSTVVVCVMVAICSLMLFGFDTIWGTVVKLLYQ